MPDPAVDASDSLYLHFRGTGPLSADGIRQLSGHLIGGLPVAPDELEVGPDGAGWVRYAMTDNVTLADVSAALAWMRQDARMAEVWWSAGVDC